MTRTAKEVAEARQVLRDDRKARKAQRPARVSHKPIEGKAFRGREVDKDYLAQIRQLPCIATLVRHGVEQYGVEAAHVRHNYPVVGWGGNPGLGVKPADWRALPLSPAEHRHQHSMSEPEFWSELSVYPPNLCASMRLVTTVDAKLVVLRAFAKAAREKIARSSR